MMLGVTLHHHQSRQMSILGRFCMRVQNNNCSITLKKEPTRKSVYASCKKSIFRSRPGDRREVRMTQAENSEHERAIKRELEELSEADRKRFEQIRTAQREKHGKETPERLHSALHTIRRKYTNDRDWKASKRGTSHVSGTLV